MTTKKFKPEKTFKDYREMLDKVELDAVVMTTRLWLHRKVSEDCIPTDVHILRVKPLATTNADCARIVELVRAPDKIIRICHLKRFETRFLRIKEWCDSGALEHNSSLVGIEGECLSLKPIFLLREMF